MLSMFGIGSQNTNQAAPAKTAASGSGSKKSKKEKVAESSDSTIIKLDENGNPIEEEEEEPLYEEPVLHIYEGGHPLEREQPDPSRQQARASEKASLQELSPKERKERHSADVKSSVSRKQGQKKGGHGGGYTWTGANDDDLPEGYVPDKGSNAMLGVSVDNPVSNGANNLNQENFNLKAHKQEFPALGNGKVPKSPQQQHAKATWAQAVQDDPSMVVSPI